MFGLVRLGLIFILSAFAQNLSIGNGTITMQDIKTLYETYNRLAPLKDSKATILHVENLRNEFLEASKNLNLLVKNNAPKEEIEKATEELNTLNDNCVKVEDELYKDLLDTYNSALESFGVIGKKILDSA